jgi:hypothetical protein
MAQQADFIQPEQLVFKDDGFFQMAPSDGRDRLLVLLDKINDGSAPTETNSPFPAGMVLWVPAYRELSVPNESDQSLKLMILEFKTVPSSRPIRNLEKETSQTSPLTGEIYAN